MVGGSMGTSPLFGFGVRPTLVAVLTVALTLAIETVALALR